MVFTYQHEQEILFFSKASIPAMGPNKFPIQGILRLFPSSKMVRARMCGCLHLAPWLRMHGALYPLPHMLSMECNETSLTLPLHLSDKEQIYLTPNRCCACAAATAKAFRSVLPRTCSSVTGVSYMFFTSVSL